jgi:hypothetical protein
VLTLDIYVLNADAGPAGGRKQRAKADTTEYPVSQVSEGDDAARDTRVGGDGPGPSTAHVGFPSDVPVGIYAMMDQDGFNIVDTGKSPSSNYYI